MQFYIPVREVCCQVDVRSVPSGPGLPGDLGGPQIHPGLEILGWPQPQLPARAPGTCRLARNPGKTQPANTIAFNNLTALYSRGHVCLTCPLKNVVILNPLQGRGPLQNPLENCVFEATSFKTDMRPQTKWNPRKGTIFWYSFLCPCSWCGLFWSEC